MNGSPKNREKVVWGSRIPVSVPASLLVYPIKNQSIACSRESLEIGGRTPLASAVRKRIVFGGDPLDDRLTLERYLSGYDAREFGVKRSSCRSKVPLG